MRLDNDFYAFTMGQFIWRNYNEVNVEYEFKCRSDIKLAEAIDLDGLEIAIGNLTRSTFITSDIEYLRSLNMFDEGYLKYLYDSMLPDIYCGESEGDLVVRYEGPWMDGVFLETPLLALINKQYAQSQVSPLEARFNGEEKLLQKIKTLQKHPGVQFSDFGSRRRYSMEWQFQVVEKLYSSLRMDQFVGTSNVRLAKVFGDTPKGTMAHQLFMVTAALQDCNIVNSMSDVLTLWEQEWESVPNQLLFLPDTYGTDFFLNNLDPDMANRWRGFRQDSGDPVEFGLKIKRYYHDHKINYKRNKRLVFSDGLDLDTMLMLYDVFNEDFIVSFGWGTNLTNDVGVTPLSIVIKPIAANGKPCCKLSDNVRKATGDSDTIKEYLKKIGYEITYDKGVTY